MSFHLLCCFIGVSFRNVCPAVAGNGLGLAQAGLWKTLLSARTQTLFIAKFNLFCPTKQRPSGRPFVPRAKKLGKAPLAATALCYNQ